MKRGDPSPAPPGILLAGCRILSTWAGGGLLFIIKKRVVGWGPSPLLDMNSKERGRVGAPLAKHPPGSPPYTSLFLDRGGLGGFSGAGGSPTHPPPLSPCTAGEKGRGAPKCLPPNVRLHLRCYFSL